MEVMRVLVEEVGGGGWSETTRDPNRDTHRAAGRRGTDRGAKFR